MSETDRESQRLAREVLMRRTPGAFFLAEEDVPGRSEQAVEADGLVWIVDPLDGTANFLHRFPMFAISMLNLSPTTPMVPLVSPAVVVENPLSMK